MTGTTDHIKAYIASLSEAKRKDMQEIHDRIQRLLPKGKLWFLDGKDESGKTVSNPNIGYGAYTIRYANGSEKEFYQIGLSANSGGISVYIMGIRDKTYLTRTFGQQLGKATVTGYCIKFKGIKDINPDALEAAIRYGAEASLSEDN